VRRAHILARNPEIELKAPQAVVRKATQNARTSTPRYQSQFSHSEDAPVQNEILEALTELKKVEHGRKNLELRPA